MPNAAPLVLMAADPVEERSCFASRIHRRGKPPHRVTKLHEAAEQTPSSKRRRALGNHECGTAPFATESLRETPAFEKLRKERNIVKMPVLEATSKYRLEALVAIGLKVTEVAWVRILSVFAVAYLTKQLKVSQSFVLEAIILATFVELLAMPFAGWLSDRVGRKAIYLAVTIFSILFLSLCSGYLKPATQPSFS